MVSRNRKDYYFVSVGENQLYIIKDTNLMFSNSISFGLGFNIKTIHPLFIAML